MKIVGIILGGIVVAVVWGLCAIGLYEWGKGLRK